MFSSLSFQLLTFAFSCYFASIVGRGDKVTILKKPTKGEKWNWQTTSPWQVINSAYTKCTIGSEDLNYIRTPFIAMPPRVRSIYVTVVYSVLSCNGNKKCSEEFALKKLEVNESLLHNEIKPERFNDTVKIIRNTNPSGNITDVIPVTVKAGGVYFALLDRSACQTLYSFEVSYKVCPKKGANPAIVGHGDKEILLSEPQEGQRWLWQSSASWVSSGTPPTYFSCTIGSPEWNILRTPLIRVPPLVTSIEISIKFAVTNCSTVQSNVECSETFDLYKFQQNTSQPNPQRFDDFKEKVKTIRPGSKHITNGIPSQMSNGSSITIPITLNSRGVFLQFEEKGACLALFAVEVTYRC